MAGIYNSGDMALQLLIDISASLKSIDTKSDRPVGRQAATAGLAASGRGHSTNPAQLIAGFSGGLQSGFVGLTAALGPAGLAITTLGAAAAGVTSSLKGLAAAASPDGGAFLGKTFDILAAQVGTVLLPALAAFAAGVLTAADAVGGFLEKNADGLASVYKGAVSGALKAPDLAVAYASGGLGGVGARLMSGPGPFEVAGRNSLAGDGGLISDFRKNFGMIVKEMKESVGNKGFSDVQSAYLKAQEAALQSGLEREKTDIQQRAVATVERIAFTLDRAFAGGG